MPSVFRYCNFFQMPFVSNVAVKHPFIAIFNSCFCKFSFNTWVLASDLMILDDWTG